MWRCSMLCISHLRCPLPHHCTHTCMLPAGSQHESSDKCGVRCHCDWRRCRRSNSSCTAGGQRRESAGARKVRKGMGLWCNLLQPISTAVSCGQIGWQAGVKVWPSNHVAFKQRSNQQTTTCHRRLFTATVYCRPQGANTGCLMLSHRPQVPHPGWQCITLQA